MHGTVGVAVEICQLAPPMVVGAVKVGNGLTKPGRVTWPRRLNPSDVIGCTNPAETTGTRVAPPETSTPGSSAGLRPSRPAVSSETQTRRTEPLKSPPLSQVAKPSVGMLAGPSVGSWLPTPVVGLGTPAWPPKLTAELPRPTSKPPLGLRTTPYSLDTLAVQAEYAVTPARGARVASVTGSGSRKVSA